MTAGVAGKREGLPVPLATFVVGGDFGAYRRMRRAVRPRKGCCRLPVSYNRMGRALLRSGGIAALGTWGGDFALRDDPPGAVAGGGAYPSTVSPRPIPERPDGWDGPPVTGTKRAWEVG